MLNALRRVISDNSNLGDRQSNNTLSEEEEQQHEEQNLQSPSHIVPPHTIVMEEDDDDEFVPMEPQPMNLSNTNYNNNMVSSSGGAAPLALVHSGTGNPSDNCTASSSLSDGSVGNPQLMDEDEIMQDEHGEHLNDQQKKYQQQQQQPTKLGVVLEGRGAAPPKMKHDPSSMAARPPTTITTQNMQHMDSAASATNESNGSSGSHRNTSSQNSSRDWGWFEDVQYSDAGLLSFPTLMQGGSNNKKKALLERSTQEIVKVNDEAAAMAVTAPTYVLEESLSSQKLWKDTAGNRPPQPVEERAFYEKMWAQNFARSQVNYSMPVEVLTAASPISLNPFADGVFEDSSNSQMMTNYNHFTPRGAATSHHPLDGANDADAAMTEAALISRMHDIREDSKYSGSTVVVLGGSQFQKVPGNKSDGELTVLLRGPNAFGTTVSKSFAQSTDNGAAIVGVDTVNISIASYRVVESKKHGKYAQFLVIYREGSIRDTVGVWKRYRDFEELSNKVTHAHDGCAAVIANMSPLAMTEEPEIEHLPNAITSWRLLQKRKRWYRCLEASYLSLKVFLLERFLHDILFESSSPKLLRDFVLGKEIGGNESD